MFGDRHRNGPNGRSAKGAAQVSAAESQSTACRGTATDMSADELSMLTDQLVLFRKSARRLRIRCALEQFRSYVAGHRITTGFAIALPIAVIAFLWR